MTINVGDVADAVYSGLRDLTGRRYLTAMWILGSALRELYATEVSDDKTALMTATLDVVREVVMTGDASEFTGQAADLERAWDRICDELDDDPSATTGQSYTWGTFMSLTQEIAGTISSGDEAFEFLTGAVTERRDSEEQAPTWINNPDELVADTSTIGRTLTFFLQVVAEVARLPEDGEDPRRIRDRILQR
jgi:hypothetical protein